MCGDEPSILMTGLDRIRSRSGPPRRTAYVALLAAIVLYGCSSAVAGQHHAHSSHLTAAINSPKQSADSSLIPADAEEPGARRATSLTQL